jgi:hypothetical protein
MNNYIAVYNGSSWSQLGNSGFNKNIQSITTGTNGYIYAGGIFTNSNGEYYVAVCS